MDLTEHKKPEVEEQTVSNVSEDNSKLSLTSNAYLESLGLIVNNGKPRFKINEPVTTVLNKNTTITDINSDDEDMSFVILGENSMNAIQASSLASYVDIQQKSMLIDYNSMIASLNVKEIQQKLTEVLQENVILKETLKQNNLAMKEQFNTLATWQEGMKKVHHSHKQKFAETKDFINHLKKENSELKNKLSTQQPKNTEHSLETIQLTEEQSLQIKKLELNSVPTSFCDSDQTSTKVVKNEKCLETCAAKDQEIACLKESIILLQKSQCILTLIELENCIASPSQDRHKFVQNIKQYNARLQELNECFTTQVDRFAAIEKYLNEITDVIDTIICDDDFILKFEKLKNIFLQIPLQYKEKLCNYRKELLDEQVKIITDRQILIKSQNQFQKIFSDYNSTLYELEIMKDENAKLNALKNDIVRDSVQNQEKSEKIICDKQSLEEEKKIFDQEKYTDYKNLHDHIGHIDYKNLLQKVESYEEHNDELLKEISSLLQIIDKKDVELEELKQTLEQNIEEIKLLKTQLTFFEQDFQQEKKLKELLLEEKKKLNNELRIQVKFNEQLQQEMEDIQGMTAPTNSTFFL